MTARDATGFRPSNYRPEIDGLRAVAVLSVIGFHAFPARLPGGFIGVDIFFVISGFLISSIIFKGVDNDKFSYSVFYAHRVRRIFPALILVLGACLVFGAWLLFPGAAAQLGLHVAAASLFTSNFILWSESGYFGTDSALKPLLHMWSLGIEEQFYLIWPLIIGACGHLLKTRLAVVAGLAVASFICGLLWLNGYPILTFYLPLTRFWELLVGALLAYVTLYGRALALTGIDPVSELRWLREGLTAAGVVLLIIALATLRPADPFPGWRALLPTLGAALIIGGGTNTWINRKILSARLAVFIGAISYPLYLWHWPLLTFPNILLMGDVSRNIRIAAVLLSGALAWITYRYVESPIRSGAGGRRGTIALALAVFLVGACGLCLYGSHGLPQRYPSVLRNVALADQTFDYAEYRERECFLMVDQNVSSFASPCIQVQSPGRDKLMLLWGDSHAASLYPGLRKVLEAPDSPYRIAQYNGSGCPPVLGFAVRIRPHCLEMNDFIFQLIKERQPDTVLMLASWPIYSGVGEYDRLDFSMLVDTVARLHDLGVRRIIVLGPLPRWQEHQPDVVLREWNRTHLITERSELELDARVFAMDRRLSVILAKSPVTFVSMVQLLCTESGCPLLTRSGNQFFPMAWDDAHLTVEGSEAVARLLAARVFP